MNRWLFNIYLVIVVSSLLPSISFATPDYARQTGFQCKECHVDPIGGGPLTKAGNKFVEDMKSKGLYRPLSNTQKIVRLFIGYIHLMTAIIWFGTILYVHILLKPAYAAKGLPKGELFLGWGSIIIILITGILLTIARMPSLEAFYTTRFGILLSIKIFLFMIMLSTALTVTFFIGPKIRKQRCAAKTNNNTSDCTVDELSLFDGKEGRPAYTAYKGIIYDVTQSRLWKDGSHMRKHMSGHDLTDALKTAPHGEDKILSFPQIGKVLLAEKKPSKPFHERLFYFFAYMNLGLTFLIIFVIALWKWW